MSLHQLIYVSTLTEGAQSELPAILETAVSNNKSKGLTGMLLYADGNVMQVLEGEKDALYALFKHIERDPRHHGIFILADTEIDSRDFETWSMGYRALSQAELKEFPVAEQFFKFKTSEVEQRALPGAALTVLKTFTDDSVVVRL